MPIGPTTSMTVRTERGSRRSALAMSLKSRMATAMRTTTIPNAITMEAIAVLQNVFLMPILVLTTKDFMIARTQTPGKMTGPCRAMRHSVTALRLAMVPAKSTVGRRSVDGIQINRACLIVAARS